MPHTTTLIDITRNLDHVIGGAGRAKAIASGAKAAYDVARPWLAKGAAAAESIGNYVGGALAVKEAWSYVRGGDGDAKKPAAQP